MSKFKLVSSQYLNRVVSRALSNIHDIIFSPKKAPSQILDIVLNTTQHLTQVGVKKLFVCCHPTLDLRVGSVGRDIFLFWWRSISFPGSYRFLFKFWLVVISFCCGLEELQNAFILIYRCEIYPYYIYILFTWKSKCSRSYYFYLFTW